jgi:hypothetical protein
MKAEDANRILGLDGGEVLSYDEGGILPPRKPRTPPTVATPDAPIVDYVEGAAPKPVVDTISRPSTKSTTTTTTGKQSGGFNWGALALLVGGLWLLSQMGKEQ